MKIRVRPRLVLDAEKYEEGKEDGFCTIGEAITHGVPSDHICPTKFKGVPYINGPVGREFPQEGDWLVQGPAGRFVRTQEQLDKDYERVDE